MIYNDDYFLFGHRNIHHSTNFLKIDQFEMPKLVYFNGIFEFKKEKWKDYMDFYDARVYLVNYYDLFEDAFELNLLNQKINLINIMEDYEITRLSWIHISEIENNIFNKSEIMDEDLNIKRNFHQHNYIYLRRLLSIW